MSWLLAGGSAVCFLTSMCFLAAVLTPPEIPADRLATQMSFAFQIAGIVLGLAWGMGK